jgi:hypothetical protein
MHEAFLSTPEGATSRQEPEVDTARGEVKARATSKQEPWVATSAGDVAMQCAAESEMKRDGSATMDEEDTAKNDLGTETKEEVEVQWADETTYVEEEPWTGDLNATWPGYMSGV